MPLSFPDLAQQKPHLLQDTARHAQHVRDATLRADRLGQVHIPVLLLALGRRFSLAQYQSAFKNQDARGTCYSFAACAALEAHYKRKSGLETDLSEQYAFHLNKVCELFDTYRSAPGPFENNSSLAGFEGSSDIIEKMSRFAVPDETAAPYLTDAQMQALKAAIPAAGTLSTQRERDAFEFDERHIPTAARHLAKYRVKSFAALPGNPTVDQVKQVLVAGYEVVADIPGHCFLIIGFDDRRRAFEVKNSWGEGQFIDYPYDFPLLGGRYITDVEPVADPQKRAWWLGRWQMDHDGWIGELVIRRFTDFRRGDSEPTRLGDYYRDGQRFDVNGTVSANGQTMDFFIAPSSARTDPGAAEGQHFQVHIFGFDPSNAAGWTSWEGTNFGVRLARAPSAHVATHRFEAAQWVAAWSMNHDGWPGLLRITQLQPLAARYETPERNLEASGAVDASHPHILHLRIPFEQDNPQAFELFHHTREDGRFSGYTTWNAHRFGVIGERRIEPVYPPLAPPGPGVMAAFIYALERDGTLLWYRHDGARHGTREWQGPRPVGSGWNSFVKLLPGGGDVIYAIDAAGKLLWYEHKGFNTGAGLRDPGAWATPHEIGHGWGNFKEVFSGGNGIIYAITPEGDLLWYRHLALASGAGLETPGSWAGPVVAGTGWQDFLHVFSTGDGIIYAIAADGTLNWYKHLGHRDGVPPGVAGAWLGPRAAGTGWNAFSTVFSRGDGVIYGIEPNGTLKWYRHLAWQSGAGLDAANSWEGRIDIGTGWQDFSAVFALLTRDPDPVR